MKKKILAITFWVSSIIVLIPMSASASGAVASVGKPQIRVQIGRRHDRGLHRGWYRGRRMAWYNYDRNDSQWTRQVYYVNGRRYVRWVRYNY